MSRFVQWLGGIFGGHGGKIWAIGDIQGCYDDFRALLEKIDFNPDKDKLWIAGDLVNRGKKSLETLEYIYDMRDSMSVVLGNHDIALIAAYLGIKKSNPTIDPILSSPKADILLGWLMEQPFVHYDRKLGYIMAHAGIPPAFDIPMALEYSKKLQEKLQSPDAAGWLARKMVGGIQTFGSKKNRYALNGFTRMRFCYEDGRLDFDQKGAPSKKTAKAGLIPWFELKNRKKIDAKIIFGHWSTLGYVENDKVVCLDTGCIWQGKMTAKRLDMSAGKIVQADCDDGIEPTG
jgi:bis(5'-nucleosyl)-tetraphosphatase (symmetrical)